MRRAVTCAGIFLRQSERERERERNTEREGSVGDREKELLQREKHCSPLYG